MSDESRNVNPASQSSAVRIDKWLWAARFFKTRSVASTAVKGGKVELDGHKAKPSSTVRAGQRLQVTKGEVVFEVEIDAVAEKRGPASQAQALYTETQASVERRTEQAAERRAARLSMPRPSARPDKKQRRQLRRFKHGDDAG
ncbi:S4 domain-containing protein [Salinisphaera sp. SPP-AMP-43]|uniref:RNA-binding S4 domain-containing protein n=1 Tax=Salinisphaera sp. SPP-AMP-43 TaxID=3121288 RepID=UPI003C6DC209